MQTVYQTDMPGLLARGKVRDIYDLGDRLMIVACDRISAFDVVMNEPVPGKGTLLTQISRFWLETLPACAPHHLDYVVQPDRTPAGYQRFAAQLAGRAMVVRKAHVLPIECVVRGYLVGGGWKEYLLGGTVSGLRLPAGLQQAQKLAAPLFTPSTKAATGHDEPISFERCLDLAASFAMHIGHTAAEGREWMERARSRTMEIYEQAAAFAASRGILLADTKFEFGVCEGELLLADEVLTPDSSRFWPADAYRVGISPPSFDKQFLRDFLEKLSWSKRPPPPMIPPEIIAQTLARYVEAFERLTGERSPV